MKQFAARINNVVRVIEQLLVLRCDATCTALFCHCPVGVGCCAVVPFGATAAPHYLHHARLQTIANSAFSIFPQLDDCTLQLYKFDSKNNECDYGSYIDLEMTIDEQNEEFEGFTSR